MLKKYERYLDETTLKDLGKNKDFRVEKCYCFRKDERVELMKWINDHFPTLHCKWSDDMYFCNVPYGSFRNFKMLIDEKDLGTRIVIGCANDTCISLKKNWIHCVRRLIEKGIDSY